MNTDPRRITGYLVVPYEITAVWAKGRLPKVDTHKLVAVNLMYPPPYGASPLLLPPPSFLLKNPLPRRFCNIDHEQGYHASEDNSLLSTNRGNVSIVYTARRNTRVKQTARVKRNFSKHKSYFPQIAGCSPTSTFYSLLYFMCSGIQHISQSASPTESTDSLVMQKWSLPG